MIAIPRVTVLMTVHNGLPYLKDSLKSLLRQTFCDFELLIVDDASTDDSVEFVRTLQDPRIRLVENPKNLGQAASLNKGLSLSTSPYVARLDQDDVCEPDRLKLQLAYLKAHPEMVACGSWITWMDAKGRRIGIAGFPVEDYGSFLGLLLGQTTPVAHPTVLIRTRAIKALGGYDTSFSPCEDYNLWCRLAERRMSVGVLPRPLLRLRLHDGQQSFRKLDIQRGHAKRAHLRLIESFSSSEVAPALSALLQMDNGFWAQCSSAASVRSVCRNLSSMLERIVQEKKLTLQENRQLTRWVSGWLARSAFLGILQKRGSSIWVYRLACRLGFPPPFGLPLAAYPAAFLLSPFFFLEPIRKGVFLLVWWVSRTRYLARLAWNSLKTS